MPTTTEYVPRTWLDQAEALIEQLDAEIGELRRRLAALGAPVEPKEGAERCA